MKRSILALSVLVVLGLSACANGGSWTPMSGGRTAGDGTVETMHSTKADSTFSQSLRK